MGRGAIIALLAILLISASAIVILQFSKPPIKPEEEKIQQKKPSEAPSAKPLNVSKTIGHIEEEEKKEAEEKPPEVPAKNESYYRLEEARFGVLQQFHRDRPWLLDLGAVWDRPAGPGDTPFRWGVIERKKGIYDWEVADDVVRWCSENGRLLIGMIFPYAEWDQIEGYGGYYQRPPKNWDAYRKFVKILVERYDGDGIDDMPGLKHPIKYWEVMNEVVPRPWGEHGEIFGFFNGTAEEYFKILKLTYEAIKEADPEAKVLLAGVADMTIGNECRKFYNKVFEMGGAKYFDIANIHWIYNLEAFKEFLSSHNISKPIWITEAEVPEGGEGLHDMDSSIWNIISCFVKGAEKIILCPRAERPTALEFNSLKTMIHMLNYFNKADKISDGCYRFTSRFGVTYVIYNSTLPAEVLHGLKNMNIIGLGGESIELIGDFVKGLIYVSNATKPLAPQPERPEQAFPAPTAEEDMISKIKVRIVNSTYKYVVSPPTGGWFKNWQNADIVLNWFGFNMSGGPLFFNHPMGIATDGKHLLLADTRNNRVLIWNKLPDGNEPPDIVLGQPNFYTNKPGDGLDELNWPVSVATDGKHVVVADTNNERILIWNEFPTRNGQPADIVLSEGPDFRIAGSWGVCIVDGKLLVSSMTEAKVYIWNSIPEKNNQPPDIVLTAKGMFGTPRTVWSDGERLVVCDHNARIGVERGEWSMISGAFFWKEFPTDDEAPDFFIEGMLWGPAMDDEGRFYLLNNYGLVVWDSFPTSSEDEPSFIVGSSCRSSWAHRRKYRFDDGDGSSIAIAGNQIYISLYNFNGIVCYRKPPLNESDLPDFAVGSPSIWNDTFEDRLFLDDGNIASDGEHLFIVSGINSKMYVWRRIPDESGAKPDIIYDFMDLPLIFEPSDVAVYDDMLVVTGTSSLIIVWNKLPLNGELPDLIIDMAKYLPPNPETGEPDRVCIQGVTIDEKYVYVMMLGQVFVWEKPILKERPPDYVILIGDEASGNIFSDGEHLIITTRIIPRKIVIYNLTDIFSIAEPYMLREEKPPKESQEKKPPEEEKPPPLELPNIPCVILTKIKEDIPFGAPQDIYSDGKHLFTVDLERNLILIWNKIPNENDTLPDIMIGSWKPMNTRNGLFWPRYIWFDGHYLWVGEIKFSSRVLRFSLSSEE
ncbi:hypothetical protein DRO64_03060 [Candidatus Bathyarchaeota archaeon]|nr:MAG: hypothetical protein DRO64_03060 [Candidatus Bathyarchaeota archaeon]